MERKARFEIGHLNQSREAKLLVDARDVAAAVERHRSGDWGITLPHEKRHNEEALWRGGTIASHHVDRHGVVFVIATNEERELTAVWTYSEGERTFPDSRLGPPRSVLNFDQRDALDRVLLHLWNQELRSFATDPVENHLFCDLVTLRHALFPFGWHFPDNLFTEVAP